MYLFNLIKNSTVYLGDLSITNKFILIFYTAIIAQGEDINFNHSLIDGYLGDFMFSMLLM